MSHNLTLVSTLPVATRLLPATFYAETTFSSDMCSLKELATIYIQIKLKFKNLPFCADTSQAIIVPA
jgi:hypothetical protein